MDVNVFNRVIAPLLLMRDSVLLCITTISDQPANFFDDIINRPGPVDGKLFRQYNFSFVCQSCRDQGITVDCEHMEERLPPWQSLRKHKFVQQMMGGNKADMERETLGLRSDDQSKVFSGAKVDVLFSIPRTDSTQRMLPYVYVSIDPNSGRHDSSSKSTSDFAIVSGYSGGNGFVFSGLESIDAREPEHYIDKLIAHLKGLRARDYMRQALFVIVVENTLGMEAGNIRKNIEDSGFTNFVVMTPEDMKTGLNTTNPIKKDMMFLFQRMLNQENFSFDANIQTSSSDVQGLLIEFKRQLKTYAQVKEIPVNSLLGTVKVGWTGKMSVGMKDDMCVAAQLLLYWMNHFWISNDYKKYRESK